MSLLRCRMPVLVPSSYSVPVQAGAAERGVALLAAHESWGALSRLASALDPAADAGALRAAGAALQAAGQADALAVHSRLGDVKVLRVAWRRTDCMVRVTFLDRNVS